MVQTVVAFCGALDIVTCSGFDSRRVGVGLVVRIAWLLFVDT